MSVKDAARKGMEKTRLCRALLQTYRNAKAEQRVSKVLSSSHLFIDRSKGCDKLCIILAGYKEPLWDDVFGRVAAYVPNDVDVCIMTSGLKNKRLMNIAEQNSWSYLSTEVNHLSLVQNVAIEMHPKAQWIYKLDEDMFITRGFFEDLHKTFAELESETIYRPAFVSPLINVSCYGHLRLLEKLNLMEDFRSTGLSDVKLSDGLHHNRQVIDEPKVAEYLWGGSREELCDIDALTNRFDTKKLNFSICPVRYSIGAILFTREAWEEFGHFPITFVGGDYGLGDDEEHICHYACFTGRVMVIDENILVGHLGYGGAQTRHMLEYYQTHRDQFALKA